MDKDTFAATIVMLGWKKEGQYQYSKPINNGLTLILCRDSGAIVINDISQRDTINEFINYDTLIALVQNEYSQ